MMLVTGAGGAVGSYVKDVFYDYELILTDKDELDIRDPERVFSFFGRHKPEIVLHLAAETDVDLCEKEPEHAFLTNTIGTQNIALACQKYGSLLIYISTAGVFDGEKHTPYTEFDTPSPLNVYGRTKLEGERVVQSLLREYFIIRTGWMMGGREKDKKFVAKIASLMKEKDTLFVVDDKWGSPTYAKDLLGEIKKLLERRYFGLWHVVNKGCCTRYEVALKMKEYMKSNIKIYPCSSAHFPLPAPRARSEAMLNYKLQLLGMNDIRGWEDALKEYLMNELLR